MNNEKRRLYKENPSPVLNEDGTVKTFQQKIKELNNFVYAALKQPQGKDNENK